MLVYRTRDSDFSTWTIGRLLGWRRTSFLSLSTIFQTYAHITLPSRPLHRLQASHILQRAALPLLDPERVRTDRAALQSHFLHKRDHVLKRLTSMGFEIKNPPNATFYIWLDLRQLPKPLSSGMVFFEECLKEKVIVVPGQFFDVNPSNRRNLLDSPCDKFVRLSFGPPLKELDRGEFDFSSHWSQRY